MQLGRELLLIIQGRRRKWCDKFINSSWNLLSVIANNSAQTVMSIDPNGPRAPTTVSVPPLRSQQGSGIDVDMDTDEESDSGDEDEEDKDPDVNDILVDISTTFRF